jgi:hypothetical protein
MGFSLKEFLNLNNSSKVKKAEPPRPASTASPSIRSRVGAQLNPFDGGKSSATLTNDYNAQASAKKQQDELILNDLRKKANDRLVQQRQTNSIPIGNVPGRGVLRPEVAQQKAYQSRMQDILETKPIQNDLAARSTFGQVIQPAIGSAGRLIASVPGNVASLVGGAIQDPVGAAIKGVEAVNPINYSIQAFNAVSPKDIPNPFQRKADIVAGVSTNLVNKVTPQPVQQQQARVGQGFENFGTNYTNSVDKVIQGSDFQTSTRPGENKVTTNLSSGLGSLGASVALSRLPGGTALPSAVFGINQAGEQYRGAREAGATPSTALVTGVQAGIAEAGLEKFGLDKYLGNFGGSSIIKNTIKNAITEGSQEALQSLAQSGVTATYKDVNWKDAVSQAFVEGAMGALLGGGSTAIVGISQNLQQKGVPKDVANKIAKQVVDKYKQATAEPNYVKLSDNELYTLSDHADTQMGTNKLDAMSRNQQTLLARQIADKAGIDITSGSPMDINNRIGKFIEDYKARENDTRQGGFIGGGELDPTAPQVGKTPQQGTELFTNFNGKKGTVVGEKDGYILVKPEFGTSTELYTKEQFDRIIGKQNDFKIDAQKTIERQASMVQADKAQAEAVQAVKDRRQGMLDYTGMTPMQKGTLDKMLNKQVNEWGKSGTLDEVIAAHNPTNKYKVGNQYVIDAADGVHSGVIVLPKTVWDRLKVPEMNRNAFGEKTPVAPQVGKTEIPDFGKVIAPKVKRANQKQLAKESLPQTEQVPQSSQANRPEVGSLDNNSMSEFTNQDASRPADEFNAVATDPRSKNTRKLVDFVKQDNKLTEQARKAQLSGTELNYYAKKDDSGRSVGIEPFNPKTHRIEGGLVLDSEGRVLGNHIKVDDTGIQVNVGGEVVNIESITGNPQDWDGSYRMMETMDRNMQRLAPDEATYRKTRRFTVDHKIKSEANLKTELKAQREALAERVKPVMEAKPQDVGEKDYNADIFDYIEGKKSRADINAKYGNETAVKIDTYKKQTRKMYDDILTRVNDTFVKFGETPVPKRKDYLTHINELNSKPSFAGEIYGQLQNSILGEGMNTTRGGVPSDIAGRTENFKPTKKWNRFFQARNGGEFTKDPFKAVDSYLEPSLYNIHMTESAVRARAVESAFRTAAEIKKTDAKAVSEEFANTISKYGNSDNSKLVTGFQEWANALAGKTQRLDRQVIDSSTGSATALKGWQALQRIGGRGTILGNAQSVLSQTLNQPLTLADVGVKNYAKAIATTLTGKTPIDQSNFIKARSTNAESNYKSKGGKVLDAGGVPLQAMELAMVKLTWNGEYHKAVADGYKGNEAVMEADRRTEQVVAGRGIADKPEAYRSTVSNGLLQYTLEVSATNKKFFQDLSTGQKAEFMVATMAMNSLMGLITGFEPLPDFLGSIVDTAGNFLDDEDKRNAKDKALAGAQNLAGEAVSFNPLTSAGANTFLSQDQRKAVFGADSSIGRFEGTAAPVQVVRNAVDTGINTAKGEFTKARNSALKILPFGNQGQKSIRGFEALRDGYAVDGSGNPTYPVANDPINAGKTMLFGPSAAREARGFYDNNQKNITGKADVQAIKDSGDKAGTVKQIQDSRLTKKDMSGKVPITDATTKDSAGDYTSRDKYDAILNAYDGSKFDKNVQRYDDNELRTAIKDVSAEAKKVFTDSNLPTDGIKFDSNMARDYASLKKSIAESDSIGADKKQKSFITSTYKNTLDNTSKSFYSLGDDAMRTKIEDGTISREQMDKVIALDDLLTGNGLQQYQQVGKTLRAELGYGNGVATAGKKSSGKKSGKNGKKSGGKGSKSGKFDYTKRLSTATVSQSALRDIVNRSKIRRKVIKA